MSRPRRFESLATPVKNFKTLIALAYCRTFFGAQLWRLLTIWNCQPPIQRVLGIFRV